MPKYKSDLSEFIQETVDIVEVLIKECHDTHFSRTYVVLESIDETNTRLLFQQCIDQNFMDDHQSIEDSKGRAREWLIQTSKTLAKRGIDLPQDFPKPPNKID